MPTKHRRYMVTDTGSVRQMLDVAQRRWPELGDRRKLLLRLASIGAERAVSELQDADHVERHQQQREALKRGPTLIDVELLLSDSAWR